MPGVGSGLFVNFVWAVGGIIVGYLSGLILNRPNGHGVRTAAGLVVLILVAAGAVLNYGNSVALARSVQCQRSFNQSYRGALQAQLDAAQQESQAQRVFINAFRGGDVAPGDRGLIYDTYLQKLSAADKLRQDHPIPVDNPCGTMP